METINHNENARCKKPPLLTSDRTSSISTLHTLQSTPMKLESEIMKSAKGASIDDGLLSRSFGFCLALFGQEGKRAHMHPMWWLPEILSQIGGMLCLLGR